VVREHGRDGPVDLRRSVFRAVNDLGSHRHVLEHDLVPEIAGAVMEQDRLRPLELPVLGAGAGGNHRCRCLLHEGASRAIQQAETPHAVLHASGADRLVPRIAVGRVTRPQFVHVRDALDARCRIQRQQEGRSVVARHGEQVL
jgi:hypothetical protein